MRRKVASVCYCGRVNVISSKKKTDTKERKKARVWIYVFLIIEREYANESETDVDYCCCCVRFFSSSLFFFVFFISSGSNQVSQVLVCVQALVFSTYSNLLKSKRIFDYGYGINTEISLAFVGHINIFCFDLIFKKKKITYTFVYSIDLFLSFPFRIQSPIRTVSVQKQTQQNKTSLFIENIFIDQPIECERDNHNKSHMITQ